MASALAIACGCRISPRLRPFVVGLSNDGRAAQVDSVCGRGVAVAPAVRVGDFSNAFDLCDSHAWNRHSRSCLSAVVLRLPSTQPPSGQSSMPRPATTHELTANFPYMLKAAFGRGRLRAARFARRARRPNPGSRWERGRHDRRGDQLER